MDNMQQEMRKRLKANTLVELLLTMILSGIIFLLVFDGVAIIKEFSNTVSQRIEAGQAMLYGHQLMEHLVENADSIVKKDNMLLFYKGGVAANSVTASDSSLVLETKGASSTLFEGFIDYRVSSAPERTNHVDSIFIYYIGTAGDSIRLEYGPPINRYAYLNNTSNDEDLR